MLMYTYTLHIRSLLRSKNLRFLAFRDTDSPDPQVLPILQGAIVLWVGEHHRLTCQGQRIHQLTHALRVGEAAGQVRDGRDPDRHRHTLREQGRLVEGVAGVVQGIVVIQDQFGQIGLADMLVVPLFLGYKASISLVPTCKREQVLPSSAKGSQSSTTTPTLSSTSCRRSSIS